MTNATRTNHCQDGNGDIAILIGHRQTGNGGAAVKAGNHASQKGGGGGGGGGGGVMDGAEKANPSASPLGDIKSQADFEDLALQHIEQIRLEQVPQGVASTTPITIADLKARMQSEHPGLTDAKFSSQLRQAMQNDKVQFGSEKNLSYANSRADFNMGGLTRSSIKPLASAGTNRVQSAVEARRGTKSGEVINSQAGFNRAISSRLAGKKPGDSIPIHELRSAIGDRVTPAQFNKWLVSGSSDNKYDLRAGATDRDKTNAKQGVTPPGLTSARYMLTIR
jgi:hypothetical protein